MAILDSTLAHTIVVETFEQANGKDASLDRLVVEARREVLFLVFGQDVRTGKSVGTALEVGRNILLGIQFTEIDRQLTRQQQVVLQIGDIARRHGTTIAAGTQIGTTIDV